jgi:hypothetical protein
MCRCRREEEEEERERGEEVVLLTRCLDSPIFSEHNIMSKGEKINDMWDERRRRRRKRGRGGEARRAPG